MGQHQNKLDLNQNFFESVYEETQSSQYFTHTKGFGYRKTNVTITNSRKILPFLKNSEEKIDEHKANQKVIMKKQFDSSTYPYSCIGLVVVTYQNRCQFGTGCLIGPSLVLTAASNVHHKDTDEHPEAIRFILNINEGEGDIYRVKKDAKISQNYLEESTGSHRYNYAVLEIQKRQDAYELKSQELKSKQNEIAQPGLIYGYLGINTKFSGLENIFIYGYSAELSDKSQRKFVLRGQRIDKLMCKNGSIGYKMQSSHSQCGSPILIRRREYFHIAGIHISSKKDLGSGLQVDEGIRKSINSWATVKEGRMDLSGKGLDSKALSLLNSKDWRHLVMLNLDNNNIICSGLIVLSKSTWPVLRELHVCNNGIGKLQFDASAFINLQIFYLSKNLVRDLFVLSDLPILRVLQLSDNRIEEVRDLICLKYLERLYLNGNKINRIPPEIQKLTDLKKLELSRNELQEIPREILKLKSLTVISLDNNSSKFENNEIKRQLEANNVQVILK